MAWRLLAANNRNNNGNLNGNNNLNNNGRFFGITLSQDIMLMKRYKNLYIRLCSKENIYLAYKNARKHKTLKSYVIEYEKNLKANLNQLREELISETYKPKPLETFIVRDPKTRKISKSDFRDRIIHHAICNIIEPIFEREFIYDSYANRIGKGTLKAIERFEKFKRQVTKNCTQKAYILKADIKQYFENVDHSILIKILERKIKDKQFINIIKIILDNHNSKNKGKGMPLGNLTSQFFANLYLNDLDQFIKKELKVKYYVRYVDDFIIMDGDYDKLQKHKQIIDDFLRRNLMIGLHKDKSKIRKIGSGVQFLGLRIYLYYRLLAKMNIRKFRLKLSILRYQFEGKLIGYDRVYDVIEGWIA